MPPSVQSFSGLDPDKRSQLGAHYTDRDKIMQIVNPVVEEPLLE
nr:type IIL restriction-modification enzyme MmeI [Pseudodonghicola flavimaris]